VETHTLVQTSGQVEHIGMALNKTSPVPLYYQLAELLKEQIRSGELAPGAQLPSERLLSERYAISRNTARQAIGYLTQEGTVVARHGLGTFVAEPKLTHDMLYLRGFTEEMTQHGGHVTSRVLEHEALIAPPQVAARLLIEPQAPVAKLVRLRLLDDTPLLLETSFVPLALCPGIEQEDMATQSLYGVLEQRYGLRLHRSRQTLEAVIADAFEAELFTIALAAPLFLLESVIVDELERPVEYAKTVYRGDRFKFAFESERSAVSDAAAVPQISLVLAHGRR
jgi:GntR family transcriptional regulator